MNLKQMNKKGQGAIIAMAIGAILLVVILSVIFSTLTAQTTTTAVSDDTFTVVNETCTRVILVTSLIGCISPGSTSSIVNSTGTGVNAIGNFTECGTSGDLFGYNMAAGADKVFDGTLVNATYTARSCEFITSGTTRTLVNLIPVLLAIAILIFIVGFIALSRR